MVDCFCTIKQPSLLNSPKNARSVSNTAGRIHITLGKKLDRFLDHLDWFLDHLGRFLDHLDRFLDHISF